MEFEEDDLMPEEDDLAPESELVEEGPHRRLFNFRQHAWLKDVPRVDDGPEVSDEAIDDFVELHPGVDEDDAEEQIWDLVDRLLDGDERVVVSRGWKGDWGLSTNKRYGLSYSVLLSADGSEVLKYSTLHLALTYEQAVERKRKRREEAEKLYEAGREKRERKEALRADREANPEKYRLEEEALQARRDAKAARKAKAREKHEARAEMRKENRARRKSGLPPVVEVRATQEQVRARNIVRSVMLGQISEDEALRRATKKGYKKEFRSELRRAKRHPLP